MARTAEKTRTGTRKAESQRFDGMAEHVWMCEHPRALRPYVGEWIAVYGEKVIAHGKDCGKVIAEAKATAPHHLLAYLDDEEEGLIL